MPCVNHHGVIRNMQLLSGKKPAWVFDALSLLERILLGRKMGKYRIGKKMGLNPSRNSRFVFQTHGITD